MCEDKDVDLQEGIAAEEAIPEEINIDPMEELKKQLDESNSEKIKLTDEVTKLNNEIETLKERLARTVAEYENYRKRTTKEKEGIYTAACEDILKEVLPVLDNLERAAEVKGSVEDIKKGIDMTVKQFNDGLERLQVEVIPTSEGFDPNFHNAVMHVEDPALENNCVAEVFQKGYKRGDKVIRCSMVKVAN
ncbi:MAG: nucleotide exchange factor GrpE [Solirubrobacterales bacterium]